MTKAQIARFSSAWLPLYYDGHVRELHGFQYCATFNAWMQAKRPRDVAAFILDFTSRPVTLRGPQV